MENTNILCIEGLVGTNPELKLIPEEYHHGSLVKGESVLQLLDSVIAALSLFNLGSMLFCTHIPAQKKSKNYYSGKEGLRPTSCTTF